MHVTETNPTTACTKEMKSYCLTKALPRKAGSAINKFVEVFREHIEIRKRKEGFCYYIMKLESYSININVIQFYYLEYIWSRDKVVSTVDTSILKKCEEVCFFHSDHFRTSKRTLYRHVIVVYLWFAKIKTQKIYPSEAIFTSLIPKIIKGACNC